MRPEYKYYITELITAQYHVTPNENGSEIAGIIHYIYSPKYWISINFIKSTIYIHVADCHTAIDLLAPDVLTIKDTLMLSRRKENMHVFKNIRIKNMESLYLVLWRDKKEIGKKASCLISIIQAITWQ